MLTDQWENSTDVNGPMGVRDQYSMHILLPRRAQVYSRDRPIGRRTRGYILATDQSDGGETTDLVVQAVARLGDLLLDAADSKGVRR
eukprot:469625-Prorocentrum_minimum.AAC.1